MLKQVFFNFGSLNDSIEMKFRNVGCYQFSIDQHLIHRSSDSRGHLYSRVTKAGCKIQIEKIGMRTQNSITIIRIVSI